MRQTKRLHEVAYDQIRETILNHQLEYGVIYSETKLSQQIGVSRTPMRDALQRLSQEGYIDIIPSKGFMLHKLSGEDLIETYHVRCALESYCMVVMAKQATTPEGQTMLNQLDSLLARQQDILETTRNQEAFATLDQQFHRAIVSFVGSDQFDEIFGSHMHRIFMFAVDSFETEGRMEDTLREHRRMLDAARSGQTEETYSATIHHMDSLKNLTLDRL